MDLFLFSNIRGTFFTGLKYYLNSRFVSMSYLLYMTYPKMPAK